MSAGFIPQEVIDEIASRCDIVTIIQEYMPLKKKGSNYQGLCPFHNEKTPSFSVSQSKQIFHCFGCGKGGNVFKFIMEMDHLTFPEAVEKLAKRAGVRLPEKELSNDEKKRLAQRKRFLQINELTSKFYHKVLLETKGGEPYLQYLFNRGVTKEIIEKFTLGATQPGWDNLYRFLLSRGVSVQEMEALGLILSAKEDNKYFDRFRQRIMFPIKDERGDIIAFGGRIIDKSVSAQKYMNSPDTPLFHKSKNLYGLDVSKANIRKKDLAILVEGYMDVISCHQYGITNTVAPLGTAFTSEQARLIVKNSYQVAIAFDGDNAGKKATIRCLDVLNDIGAQAKAVVFEEGLDPDEFLKKRGILAFEQLISKSQEPIVYKMVTLLETINTDSISGKLKIVHELLPDLNKMQSQIAKENAIETMSRYLQITESALLDEYKKFMKNQNQSKNQYHWRSEPVEVAEVKASQGIDSDGIYKKEAEIIKILFENNQYLTRFEQAGGQDLFDSTLKMLYVDLIEKYNSVGHVTISDFSDDNGELLAGILMEEYFTIDPIVALRQYLAEKKQASLDIKYTQLVEKLAEAEKMGAVDEMQAALKGLEEVRAERKKMKQSRKGE